MITDAFRRQFLFLPSIESIAILLPTAIETFQNSSNNEDGKITEKDQIETQPEPTKRVLHVHADVILSILVDFEEWVTLTDFVQNRVQRIIGILSYLTHEIRLERGDGSSNLNESSNTFIIQSRKFIS